MLSVVQLLVYYAAKFVPQPFCAALAADHRSPDPPRPPRVAALSRSVHSPACVVRWRAAHSHRYPHTVPPPALLQCNNPLTKEAKLKAAVRIAPEWADYDNEIREFQATVKAGKLPENASTGEAASARGTTDTEHWDRGLS